MLLSCLVFVTDHNHFDRSWQLNFFFFFCRRPYLYNQSRSCSNQFLSQSTLGPINQGNPVSFSMQIAPVQSITLLSCLIFIQDDTQFGRYQQFNFGFDVDQTYTISHIIVLIGFRNRSCPIESITITQFCFQRRPHLYDQSHSCLIWPSSKWAPNPIYHIIVLSGFHHRLHPIQSVMKVQYLFGIEHTCTIDHIVVLSDFHHRPQTVRQVPTIQFWFQRGQDLYDRSRSCPLWFS